MTREWFRHYANALGRPVLDLTGGVPLRETTAEQRAGLLPPWMCRELIATPASRERLRLWIDAGSPMTRPEDVPAAGVDLEPELRAALAELPPPVLLHLARSGYVLALGRAVAGWCATPPPPRADAVEGRRVLVCQWRGDAADFRSTTFHEVSHHYLEQGPAITREPLPLDATRERHEDRATLVRCAAEWDLLPRIVNPAAACEMRAAALARSWGATGSAADGCAQRRFTATRIGQEAAAAVAAGAIQ